MWTIENFKKVYERYESSNLSARDFCYNERITRSRFYYWRKQYRKLVKPEISVSKVPCNPVRHRNPSPPSGFIPVMIASGDACQSSPLTGRDVMPPAPASLPAGTFMEVCYASGTSIRLLGGKDMEPVKTLIHLSR